MIYFDAFLVRGASSQEDVREIAQVDTHSNPADGLSRLGVCDAWTSTQQWSLCEYNFLLTSAVSFLRDLSRFEAS